MLDLDDTIAAIASPPGGALRGIVRLSGPASVACTERFFLAKDGVKLATLRQPRCVAGTLAIGDGWGPWAAEILADLGLRFDGHVAERIAAAAAPLNRVRQDAAILLHDRGADADEVAGYLQRWSLVSSERARQQIRFLTHPLWRAYISTYVEGFDLLSRWLHARPAEQSVADRFVRLLDEPLTPRAVLRELAV